MRPRRLGLCLLLCCIWFGLAGCERSSGDHLVVYSAGPRPLIDAVVEQFESETGHTVELYAATTGQVMARLEAEKYRPRADVVVLASQLAAHALKDQQRLLAYRPSNIDQTRKNWHDPDGFYHATGAAIVAMAVHEEAESPPDWEQAMAGDWPGRLIMPSPSRSGTAADFLITQIVGSEEDIWQRWHQARSHAGLDFAAANSQAITSLAMRAHDGMLAAADYLIYRQIAAGASLAVHYPADGSVLVSRPIVIMADTPRQDMAKAFVDHYFSEQVQQMVAAQHLLPAHLQVAVSAERAGQEPPLLLSADPAEALAAQIRILRRFQLEVERAQVLEARSQ